MNIAKEIEKDKYKIEIYYDDCPGNPREEWDNLGNMICWHRRYNLGDKHSYSEPRDFIYELCRDFHDTQKMIDDYNLSEEEFINKYLSILEKHIVILPLYLYDHSGITINTTGFSCPWDSGQIGWIYATKEKMKKEYGWKCWSKKREERIIDYLKAEVETYDCYLTGNIYGFFLYKNDKEIDSCGGFFNSNFDINGMLDFVKETIKDIQTLED